MAAKRNDMKNSAIKEKSRGGRDAAEIYRELIERVVQGMRAIIAGVAITQANVVAGLAVSKDGLIIKIEREPADVLEDLVSRYERIMGPVAIRLAKKAIRPALEKERDLKLPNKLLD